MSKLSRRSVLQVPVALVAAGTLGRPYIANAAAKTVTAWWTQGFVPEEDAAIKRVVAEYEKQSGDTIDLSIIPFGPLGQKVVSALTSGNVPDVVSYDAADLTIVPQNAWNDRLLDLSDIVEKVQVGIFADRQPGRAVLQQCHEEARLLHRALQDGLRAVPYLGRPGEGSRV